MSIKIAINTATEPVLFDSKLDFIYCHFNVLCWLKKVVHALFAGHGLNLHDTMIW